MLSVKEEIKKIANTLPENATWEDAMHEIYVREKIEKAIEEADRGNLVSHEEAKKRLLFK